MKTINFRSISKSLSNFLLLAVVATIAFTSCRGKEELGSEDDTPGGSAADNAGKPGVVDATSFSVITEKDDKYTYFIHKIGRAHV